MSEFRRRLMMQGGGTGGKYIKFADPVVEQICMKWSSDGIGLTPEDAAKVTDIGNTFKGNTEITSFEELSKFGVNSISDYAFEGCSSLTSLTLPVNISKIGIASFWKLDKLERLGNFNNNPNITEINVSAFKSSGIVIQDLYLPNLVKVRETAFSGCVNLSGKLNIPSNKYEISRHFDDTSISRIESLGSITTMGSATISVLSSLPKLEFVRIPFTVTYIGREFLAYCRNLKVVIIEPDVPPQLDIYAFHLSRNDVWDLFVPDESVDAYKSATNWSTIANRIKPLSEFVEPNE